MSAEVIPEIQPPHIRKYYKSGQAYELAEQISHVHAVGSKVDTVIFHKFMKACDLN